MDRNRTKQGLLSTRRLFPRLQLNHVGILHLPDAFHGPVLDCCAFSINVDLPSCSGRNKAGNLAYMGYNLLDIEASTLQCFVHLWGPGVENQADL